MVILPHLLANAQGHMTLRQIITVRPVHSFDKSQWSPCCSQKCDFLVAAPSSIWCPDMIPCPIIDLVDCTILLAHACACLHAEPYIKFCLSIKGQHMMIEPYQTAAPNPILNHA